MPLAYGVGFALLPAAIRALESPYRHGDTGGLGGAIGPIRPIRTAFFLIHPARKAFTTHKKTPPKPALTHGEKGACFTKNKKPEPNPDLTPDPSPMGRGEHAS